MPVDQPVRSKLSGLTLHTAGFRQAVDGIFTRPFQTHTEWLRYFWTILQFASQLYADYVLLTPDLNPVEALDDSPKSPLLDAADESDVQTEMILRKRYSSALRGVPFWRDLRPNAPFAEITGLRKADDFIQSLVLHLPEAYVESIRVERWAKELSAGPSAGSLASLIVGLEHMSRNHLLFALPALQFAADETSWDV